MAHFTQGAPLTIAGTLTLNDNIVHLALPTDLGAGTYTLATYDPTAGTFTYTRRDPALTGMTYHVFTSTGSCSPRLPMVPRTLPSSSRPQGF